MCWLLILHVTLALLSTSLAVPQGSVSQWKAEWEVCKPGLGKRFCPNHLGQYCCHQGCCERTGLISTDLLSPQCREMLHLGKDWPQGFDYFQVRLKKAFMKNREITDPEQIEKCIKHAEFVKKEIETLYMLKKYRTLKRRYSEN